MVPAAELDAAVGALAARLAAAPRGASAAIKAGLWGGETADLAAALDAEAGRQDACFHAPDFVEGVTASFQRRPARFA